MKSNHWLIASLIVMTSSIPAEAAPVTVQTLATAGNAAAGELGATVASSAMIGVLVLGGDGKPVSNLGANLGNQNSVIALPSGWTLTTNIVPPGGCLMVATEFSNPGMGIMQSGLCQS